jgi:hypothetical protein
LISSGTLSNPFPGLRPFETDEDHLFFGREKQTDELLRRLRSCRFLTVVGTSGSGKSSLVRSGLIPALQSGFMAKAGSSWRIATLRPGEDPISHLALALSEPNVLGTDRDLASTNRILVEATVHRSTRGLVEAVRQARIPPDDNVLVLVDQFEELFRFRQNLPAGCSREEAATFVKLLLEATQQNEIPIYVVATLRSDFIGDCMEFAGLPEAVNEGIYLVPRMAREELRSAITGPVRVARGEIAPRLVLRLLNDVGGDHDQLPVLQHALMRTWDHWRRHHEEGPIDIADYEAIGTMRKALSLHAEEAYKEASSTHNPVISARIFKALTDTFSDPRGVRRPTAVRQLSQICEVSETDVIEIVDIFRQPRRSFLTPPAAVPLDSASIIDISHESLMRCWSRLITWAEEERLSARAYARLSQAAAWHEEGTAGLWQNPELELGLRWKRENHPSEAWASRYNTSFAQAMAFLNESEANWNRIEAEREKQRRNKLKLAWTVAGALGVLLAVALSFYHLARSETARAEANLRLARKAVDETLSSAGRQQARESPDPPQLEQFRKELLDKAEKFYTNYLAQQSKHDPEFRAESASQHSKLGDIDRLLKKYEDAVGQYRAAISGFEELLRDRPRNPEYREALAYAHNWLGETLRAWSEETQAGVARRSEAEQEYDYALELQEGLHQEFPENRQYQQELARTYYNRGILRYDGQNLKASKSDFQKAIQLLEPLVSKGATPQTEQAENPPSHDLARVYNDLGVLLFDQVSIARPLFERAIGIQEDLVSEKPENWEYRVELAQFYNNLAFLAWETNDMELAKQKNHAALDTLEDLATPSALIEKERAYAHMLNWTLGSSDHPAFHVLYFHLANEYVKLATAYLNSPDPSAARLPIEALGHILSDLAEPDRSRLRGSYLTLEKELQESSKKSK